MDFNDTPAEAKFRAGARAFLERHTELLEPGEAPPGPFIGDDPGAVRRSQDWQGLKVDHGWAASRGRGSTGAGASRPCTR